MTTMNLAAGTRYARLNLRCRPYLDEFEDWFCGCAATGAGHPRKIARLNLRRWPYLDEFEDWLCGCLATGAGHPRMFGGRRTIVRSIRRHLLLNFLQVRDYRKDEVEACDD